MINFQIYKGGNLIKFEDNNKLFENEKFQTLFKDVPRRRQSRKGMVYKETGVVYATRVNSLLKYNSVIGKKVFPLITSKRESIDINDELDFQIAECISKIYL